MKVYDYIFGADQMYNNYWHFTIGTHLNLGFHVRFSPNIPFEVELGLLFVTFTLSRNKIV